METPLKNVLISTLLLIAVVCLDGCATRKVVTGHWRNHAVVADGLDDEWQNECPQYYDEDQHITVRIINNTEALSLSVSTGDQTLQRQLRMAGLTVWFDPQGGKEHIFGLHLPAADRIGPGPPEGGDFTPPGPQQRPQKSEARPPTRPTAIEPIKALEISYSNTTGPLRMTIEEVRRTGINIGAGLTKEGRLVYEFDINFSAAPSLSELKPGMVVGIGILAASAQQPGPMGPMGAPPGIQSGSFEPGGGMGRPGGGMGRPGGGGGPGGKGRTLELWLKVRLADPAAG